MLPNTHLKLDFQGCVIYIYLLIHVLNIQWSYVLRFFLSVFSFYFVFNSFLIKEIMNTHPLCPQEMGQVVMTTQKTLKVLASFETFFSAQGYY